ncbi:MAG: hypothetical protein DMG65_15830 [Candidatus Angelobacter sp. Gp1-AA117]|nr:MAG: hypothetical protein DMG65_15830 [Candidatus Angelobacter sp. Gp1-AA117]
MRRETKTTRKNSAPNLSVIIPYSGSPLVSETLASLSKQTLPSDQWELIFVAEQSMPLPLINLQRLTCRVRVVPFSKPEAFRGHTAGILRNIGVRLAVAPTVVFVDSDAILSPICLSEHLKLHSDSATGLLTVCGMWLELPAYRQAVLNGDWKYSDLVQVSIPDFRSGPARRGTWQDFYSGNVSLQRKIFSSAGGFDERGLRCHDMDLAYRLSLRGAQFRISPECSAIHIEHPRSLQARAQQAKGWIHLGEKHPEIRSLARQQAASLRSSFRQIRKQSEKLFVRFIAGLRGTRKGLVWYCEASCLRSLWRRLANTPTSARECDEGVRLFLRLHRQCWDYSVVVKAPPQPPKPKISVLLPTYNRADCLRQCICSVLTQTLWDFELIVVDDASTDRTCEVLSSFSADPRIRVFLLSENRGLAHCLNRALDVSIGSFVVHLDSDDTLVPTALERLYRELRRSRIGAVCTIPNKPTHGLKRNYTPEELLASLDYTAPRGYRTALLRAIGGWSTDDAYEGRFFEDRLTLARVSEQAKVKPIHESLCVIRRTPDSLSKQANANVAKFAIITQFANSRSRQVRISRAGTTVVPSFFSRRTQPPEESWSVVIPVRDNSRLLDYVLRGWAQSDLTTTNHEVIVVDDGSHTLICQPPHNLNVRVIRSTHSHGPAHARNLGAMQAKNNYIYFCDSDHVVPVDVISKHEATRRNSDQESHVVVVGAVLGRRAAAWIEPRKLQPDTVQRIFNLARFDSAVFDKLATSVIQRSVIEVVSPRCTILYKTLCKFAFSDHSLCAWAQVLLAYGNTLAEFHHSWLKLAGGSFSIARRSFWAIGGFDEQMLSMEDWDLGARLQKAGYSITCSPEAEPHHLIHARDDQRDRNNRSAVSRMMDKHPELIKHLLEDHAAINVPGRPLIEHLIEKETASFRKPSITRHCSSGRVGTVCFTFDDGPDPIGTSAILNVLTRNSAKATFFVLGEKLEGCAELCRRLIAGGHEIGVHGWTHHPVTTMSLSNIRQSLRSTLSTIESLTATPVRWARPPHGTTSTNYVIAVREVGLKIALWDVSPRDWSCPTRFELLSSLLSHDLEGRTVLLHDGSGDPTVTADCLDYLIPRLRSAGIQPVTLSEFQATHQFSKPNFPIASKG